MAITWRKLTLEDFLKLPEAEPPLEYLQGRVSQKVTPLGEHAALQGGLILLLDRLFGPSRVARAFPELRVSHGGASLVPDVSVYRWERIPRTAAGRVASRFVTPPDLASEIWSPGQTIRDLAEKCEWFVANGSHVALLLDHRQETIRVFRPHSPVTAQLRGDRIALDEIAPGAALDVDIVFAALDAD